MNLSNELIILIKDKREYHQILDNKGALIHTIPYLYKIIEKHHAFNLYKYDLTTLYWALKKNYLFIVTWIYQEHKNFFTQEFVYQSIKLGCIDIIKWFVQVNKESPFLVKAIDIACKFNNTELVHWLYSQGLPASSEAMNNAAENGNLDLLEWLQENCDKGCTTDAMSRAAAAGHFNIINWLDQHNYPSDSWAISAAIINGRLDILEWFFERKRQLFNFIKCLELAQEFRQYHVIEWLNFHYNYFL